MTTPAVPFTPRRLARVATDALRLATTYPLGEPVIGMDPTVPLHVGRFFIGDGATAGGLGFAFLSELLAEVQRAETAEAALATIASLTAEVTRAKAAETAISLAQPFPSRAAFAATKVPAATSAVILLGYATFGDGPLAPYVRMAAAPANPMPWHVQTADGAWWMLAIVGDVWPHHFGSWVADGATDMSGPINNALLYAGAALGGGVVRLPAGSIGVSANIKINYPHTKLRGMQADGCHDTAGTGPGFAGGLAAQSLGTQLVWNGGAYSAGSTSSDIILCQSLQAAQLGGIEVSGIKGVSGAATCGDVVHAIGVQNSWFDNLFGVEVGGAVMHGDCNQNAEGSFWKNRIGSVGGRIQNTSGNFLRFTGSGYSNCYNNIVEMIHGEYSYGDAIYLGDSDNNLFYQVRTQRVDNANKTTYGKALRLAADGYGARLNTFFHFVGGEGGVVAEGTEQNKKDPSGNLCATVTNRILRYNPIENNAPVSPSIGTGATLDWSSTEQGGAVTKVHMSYGVSIAANATTVVPFDTINSDLSGNSHYAGGDDHNWYDPANKWFFPRMPGFYHLRFLATVTPQSGDGANAKLIASITRYPITNLASSREGVSATDYLPPQNASPLTVFVDCVMYFDGVTDCATCSISYYGSTKSASLGTGSNDPAFTAERCGGC